MGVKLILSSCYSEHCSQTQAPSSRSYAMPTQRCSTDKPQQVVEAKILVSAVKITQYKDVFTS